MARPVRGLRSTDEKPDPIPSQAVLTVTFTPISTVTFSAVSGTGSSGSAVILCCLGIGFGSRLRRGGGKSGLGERPLVLPGMAGCHGELDAADGPRRFSVDLPATGATLPQAAE